MQILKTCRACGVQLEAGANWTEGLVRSRTYLCRTCNSAKGKAHYAAHAERSAEMQRARLAKPKAAMAIAGTKSRYYAENKERWAAYRITQKDKEASLPWHRAGRLLTWIRARAGKTDRLFDLTHEWLAERLERGVCEVTGVALELSKPPGSRFHPWAPSVDRIDCKKGYTQDNCRVVCWIYNMAKSEWSDEIVTTFALALAERQRK